MKIVIGQRDDRLRDGPHRRRDLQLTNVSHDHEFLTTAGDDGSRPVRAREKTAIETSSSILRDAHSAGSGLFCQFGLMADDYAPKPAFDAYRGLIRQM